MRKRMVVLLSLVGLLLCGCQGGEAPSGAGSGGESGTAGMADGAGASDGSGTEVGTENGAGAADGSGTEVGAGAADGRGTESGAGTSDGRGTESGAGAVDGSGTEVGAGTSDGSGTEGGAGTSEHSGKDAAAGEEAVQGGPYGQLSLCIPEGWSHETYSTDSAESYGNRYGIRFHPEGAAQGYVELMYEEFFGVCGTGLESRDAVIAGNTVSIGTYDGHPYWNFICFQGEMDGVVAVAYDVGDWWGTYGDQVMEILDTAVYDPDIREGGAWIFKEDSEIEKIGLNLSLRGISATGATLVFNQYDRKAPTGSLQFGDDYVIERLRDGKWEEVPVVVVGNYGFNAVAYVMAPGEATEKELDWEWLYGELEPGEYRISKGVDDFRGTGDYDKYTVYAYFILN